jgi:hypothetical protein
MKLKARSPLAFGNAFLCVLRQGIFEMQMAAAQQMNKLRELLGAYHVSATSEVGANTEALIEKVKNTPEFTEMERTALVRALEWCARREQNGK